MLHYENLNNPERSTSDQSENRVSELQELANVNLNSFSKSSNQGPFLQVLPIYICNKDGKKIKANALLDSGSDSTLISKTLADSLNLRGKDYQLNLSNVLNYKNTFTSSLVDFSICSDIHPESINVHNVWVVENLNLPKCEVNPKQLREEFSHLQNVDFCSLAEDNVSILIGADLPELHISY